MPVTRWNRTQRMGKRTYWLLTISYAGQSVRISTAELDIETDDGDVTYSAGLDDITVSDGLEMFASALSPARISMSAVFPVDVAALVAVGHDLSAATAEIAEWIEGTTYESRRPVLVGRVVDPEYGAAELPVRFTIDHGAVEDTSIIPDRSARIYAGTTNTAFLSEADLEIPYPQIFGHPGQIDDDTLVTGSQAYWRCKATYHHELVVSGHRTQLDYVYLNNDTDTTPVLFAVEYVIDGLGREIGIVPDGTSQATGTTPIEGATFQPGLDATTVSSSYQPATATPARVFVLWKDPDNTEAGGIIGRDGQLLRGAGDILIYLLARTNVGADLGKVKAIAPLLNGFKLDFVLDGGTKPMEFIAANLLPILPVSIVDGPDGWYFVVWNYAATANDAIAAINEDINTGITFGEYIRYDAQNVANEFELSFALSIRTGEYQRSISLGARGLNESANADFVGFNKDRIRIHATATGNAGDGIVVTFTGPGALAVAEDAAEKTVTVTLAAAGTNTTQEVIDAINAGLTTVRAALAGGAGTAFVSGSADLGTNANGTRQTITLRLRQSIAQQSSMACSESKRRNTSTSNRTGIIRKAATSLVIYEPATAGMVLAWWSRAFCFAHRFVNAIMPADEYDWLVKGNVVALTSVRLGLSATIAHIEDIEGGDDGLIAVRFRMIEDPPRDARA